MHFPAGKDSLPFDLGNGIHGGKARVNVSDSSQYLSSLLPHAYRPSRPRRPSNGAGSRFHGPMYWPPPLHSQSVGVQGPTLSAPTPRPNSGRPAARSHRLLGARGGRLLGRLSLGGGGHQRGKGDRTGDSASLAPVRPRPPRNTPHHGSKGSTITGPNLGEWPDRPADRDGPQRVSDLLPLVAVLAASIPRRSRIYGASHAAYKESDQRRSTVHLVKELGAFGSANARGLEVRGSGKSARFETALSRTIDLS